MENELRKRLPNWTGEPREVADSFNLLARQLELVARAVPEIVAGPGIFISASGGKVVVSASRGLGGAGGVITRTPFEPIDASSASVPKVNVIFGIVNNIIPTIHDATTGDDVPMDGTTGTPPRPPELATPTTGKGYLMTVWTGDEPKYLESAEVKFGTVVPGDDDTHGHQLLFSVTLNEAGTAVASLFKGATSSYNVQRAKCGDDPAQYFFTGVTSGETGP